MSERSKYEGGGGNLRSTDGCGHHRCKERKDETLFFLFLLFAQCPPPATHQGGSLRSSLARCNPLGFHCQGRMGALPIPPPISSPTALLISGKRRRDETTEREIRPFSYVSLEENHSPLIFRKLSRMTWDIFPPLYHRSAILLRFLCRYRHFQSAERVLRKNEISYFLSSPYF